jgi:CRP-like cAMP-binding protein
MTTKRARDAALRAVPLFDGLTARQIRRISSIAEMADYMQGATIVREGAEGDAFYMIVAGEAKVTRRGRTLARLAPGDHFGEISLIDGGKRTASVVSVTPMTLLVVGRREFTTLLRSDPAIGLGLMRGLARMIRSLERGLGG